MADEEDKLYSYNPVTDTLVYILPIPRMTDFKSNNEILVGQSYRIHDIAYLYESTNLNHLKTVQICPKGDIPFFWHLRDNKLVVISEVYVNPYGQIHDDYKPAEQKAYELKDRNLKIIQFDVTKF